MAGSLLDQYEPNVLVAGANPVMRPLRHQTWETFSANWHTDVKIAFTWLREALAQATATGRPGAHDEARAGSVPTRGSAVRPRRSSWNRCDLVRTDAASTAPGYLLTATGLQQLP